MNYDTLSQQNSLNAPNKRITAYCATLHESAGEIGGNPLVKTQTLGKLGKKTKL